MPCESTYIWVHCISTEFNSPFWRHGSSQCVGFRIFAGFGFLPSFSASQREPSCSPPSCQRFRPIAGLLPYWANQLDVPLYAKQEEEKRKKKIWFKMEINNYLQRSLKKFSDMVTELDIPKWLNPDISPSQTKQQQQKSKLRRKSILPLMYKMNVKQLILWWYHYKKKQNKNKTPSHCSSHKSSYFSHFSCQSNTARYYTSHTKTMLPTRKSMPRSSRQLDHMKISWRS